jgi:uncharacterized coiled-coil protein SlyX
VPEEHADDLTAALHDARSEIGHAAAEAKLRRLVRRLHQISPDAAASLAERLQETITVIRLPMREPPPPMPIG